MIVVVVAAEAAERAELATATAGMGVVVVRRRAKQPDHTHAARGDAQRGVAAAIAATGTTCDDALQRLRLEEPKHQVAGEERVAGGLGERDK